MQITELPRETVFDIYFHGFAHASEIYSHLELNQLDLKESFKEWWNDLLDEELQKLEQ